MQNRFNDTNTNMDRATGRAIDNRAPFPFPLKNVVYSSNDKPSNHRSNYEPRIVYAATPVQRTNTLLLLLTLWLFTFAIFISFDCFQKLHKIDSCHMNQLITLLRKIIAIESSLKPFIKNVSLTLNFKEFLLHARMSYYNFFFPLWILWRQTYHTFHPRQGVHEFSN